MKYRYKELIELFEKPFDKDVFILQLFELSELCIKHFYEYIQIVSGKYLILCFVLCIYLSYTSLNDKPVFTSYTSDNYNDYILNLFTNRVLSLSKFNIHLINNKILHPITIFLQNI